MSTRRLFNGWKAASLMTLLMLTGCPASLPPAPPVIAKQPEATPLPAGVLRIDPKSSQALLRKVDNYLLRLDALSKGEMPN